MPRTSANTDFPRAWQGCAAYRLEEIERNCRRQGLKAQGPSGTVAGRSLNSWTQLQQHDERVEIQRVSAATDVIPAYPDSTQRTRHAAMAVDETRARHSRRDQARAEGLSFYYGISSSGSEYGDREKHDRLIDLRLWQSTSCAASTACTI